MNSDILESVKEIVPTASEHNLLAELEAKYAALYRQLEASFTEKEKKWAEASAAKERALVVQLDAARQQLWLVILVALFSIAVMWNFKFGAKEAVAPVPSASSGSVQAVAPDASLAAFVMEANVLVPATAPQAPSEAKAGNGGNFAGGQSAVKN